MINGVNPGTGNTAGTAFGNEDGAHFGGEMIHPMQAGETFGLMLFTLSGTIYAQAYYNGFYGFYLSSL
tara:strand:- start:292 stop:495 length:204 start_codon:yes stop_codon:yes gene_type:complete